MAQGSSRDRGHVPDEKDDTDKRKCNEIMRLRNKHRVGSDLEAGLGRK